MNIIISTILIGSLTTTAYRSVPSQTDSSPFHTSIGQRTHPHGVAVSQDLLKTNGGPLDYGDLVYIDGVGFKFVNDVMNKRHKQRLDVWVASHKEEQIFHKKFKNKQLKIWLVKREIK